MKRIDIIKAISAVGLGNISAQGFGLIFMMILVRVISKSDYGEVRYILSLGGILSTFSLMGLPSTLSRYLAKYKFNKIYRKKYFSNIFIIYLIIVIIISAFSVILYKYTLLPLVIIGPGFVMIYKSVTRGLMYFKKYSLVDIARNIIKIILLILCAHLLYINVDIAIVIYSLGGLIGIIIIESFWRTRDIFDPHALSFEIWKEVLIFSIPIMIATMGNSLITNMPIIFLKLYSSNESAATYSVAFTIANIFSLVSGAIITVIMPHIAASQDFRKIKKLIFVSIMAILLLGSVFVVGSIMIGEYIICFLFTNKYIDAYLPLIVLSLGALLFGIKSVFSALWIGIGKTIYEAYVMFISSCTIILTSYIFINLYGVIGAAIGYLISSAVAVITNLFIYAKYVRKVGGVK